MRLTEVFLSSLLVVFVLETPVYAGKKCPKLNIQNGRVKIRARGKMAYFKCRKRYSTLGDKFAVCLQTGTWSHPPPLCISRGCPSLGALPNVQITESYNGAMLKFECPMGTQRKGPETITCDGRQWSDTAPSCGIGLTMGCDFEEEGLCGWSQDESDNFDWTRKSGRTPTMSTGPPGDHTTGSGFYMFIESSSPRKVGDVARLISPAFPPSLRNICFEFYYHMQGPADPNAVGSLEVFIKPETASLVDIDPEFYMDGNQGPEWQRGFVQIPNQDENFKIVIVGTRKDAFVSDIAIDDLRLFNCSEETTTVTPATTLSTPSPTGITSMAKNFTEGDTLNVTQAGTGVEVTTKVMMVKNVTESSYTTIPKAVTSSDTSAKTSVTSVTSQRTTLRTTAPVTTPRTAKHTTTVSVKSTTNHKTRRTKAIFPTKALTSYMTSSTKRSTSTSISTTRKDLTTTSAPHMAVTTVYNFSNLATDVMEISTNQNPTSQKGQLSNVTKDQMDTSTQKDDNVTSSDKDGLISSTMGNDINTPPTSSVAINKSGISTTDLSNIIPTVKDDTGDTRQRPGSRNNSIIPLIVGITAGIVVGMIVIAILAWLWARSQRKKKEREAAEDEMYMLSTGDAAGCYK